MRAAPFVILAIVLSGFAPKSPGTQSTSAEQPVSDGKGQPPKGKIVHVEIVVATPTRRTSRRVRARTSRPDHLRRHSIRAGVPLHGPREIAPAYESRPGTLVERCRCAGLSAGQQIRWFSTTHTFVVVSVEKGKELPQSPSARQRRLPPPLPRCLLRRSRLPRYRRLPERSCNATRSRSTSLAWALSTRT